MKKHCAMTVLMTALLSFGTIGSGKSDAQVDPTPELVEIPTGAFDHRLSGEFLKNGYPVDGPLQRVRFPRLLHIMKYQVSSADYAACVDDDMCEMPFESLDRKSEKPVVGVSFIDTQNYARWLSQKTGTVWRLPTDAEWSWAADDRFFDDALGVSDNVSDPSKRWIKAYEKSANRSYNPDPIIKSMGAFGANKNGVYDQSGNIWEWTDTCYQRYKIAAKGALENAGTPHCGVRVVEGRHRTYMTVFVQDAKSGGCSVGTPPDYLGFRLVRDNPKFLSLKRFQNWLVSL